MCAARCSTCAVRVANPSFAVSSSRKTHSKSLVLKLVSMVGETDFTLSKRIKHRIAGFLVKHLTKERRGYTQRFPNDIDLMVKTLKPGDVVLVEGSQRVSEVIKYLTQSCWSHACIYVGDTLISRGGPAAEALIERFEDEAGSLVVEANADTGVVAVPLSKYRHHNVRVCRPINLRPGDLNTVLQTVISQIGTPYSVRHIIDLLRYFFPVSLIPRRFRHTALQHAGPFSKQVICSSQITMAFQKVRYPIQPHIDLAVDNEEEVQGILGRILASARLRKGRSRVLDAGVFTPCDPRLVTPRDFDLSPYFEIIKFHHAARTDFDYKKIVWTQALERELQSPATLSTSPREGSLTLIRSGHRQN